MRPPKIWSRKGRDGWWATIHGKQVNLGTDRKAAELEFHRIRGGKAIAGRTRLTIRESCEMYLEWASTRVKPATHEIYRSYLLEWGDFAGHLKVSDARPHHVTQWLAGRGTWGSSTRHVAVSVVKLWSAWCKSEGHVDENPLRDVRRPKMKRRAPAATGAIEDTFGGIFCDAFRDFATILLDIGCRPGELRTLEATGIDWKASTASVAGKTGPRELSLTSRAVIILRGYAGKYPAGPVLRNSRGNPWTESAVECQFRRCSARAGRRVSAYHCRHDFWTRAHKAGVSDLVIAKQMGHVNLAMLAKHYAAVDAEMTLDAVERASEGIRHASPGSST